jgi:transcriptional regulator with XRE-family HTH domain
MKHTYNPLPLAQMLRRLMEERGTSQRQASLEAGLDRAAMYRFVEQGHRPSRESLIALADYFGVNPNDLFALAGYPPLSVFEAARAGMPPELEGVIDRLMAIQDLVIRSQVISAMEVLLDGWARTHSSDRDG